MNAVLKHSAWMLVGLLVVAGAAWTKVSPMLRALPSPPAAEVARSAPLRVSTVIVQPQPLTETVTATGTLRAEESIELQAESDGRVIAIGFSEGAPVRRGQLLIKLSDAELRATLARAMHRRELAALRERRIAQLLRQGVARQEEYDTALSELNVQDAEIALTRAQIARTEIRAPFDGVVGLRSVSEGALVTAATRVASLQRLENLKLDFSLPEKYAGRVRVGSTVTFTVAGSDQRFPAEVYAFDPQIEAATRTVLIRALSPNPVGRLLPGAFARVAVDVAQVDDAILVPAVAVVPGEDGKRVFVVSDGRAVPRDVETGVRSASSVHVVSGLMPGDAVITSGLQQLRPGAPVLAESADSPPPPP